MENKFCEHCGAAMEPDDFFCPSCGQRIIDIKENENLTKPDISGEPESPEKPLIYQTPETPEASYTPVVSQTYQEPQAPEMSQGYQAPQTSGMPGQPNPFARQSSGANPFKQFSSSMNLDPSSSQTSNRGIILGGIIAIIILAVIIGGIILFSKIPRKNMPLKTDSNNFVVIVSDSFKHSRFGHSPGK